MNKGDVYRYNATPAHLISNYLYFSRVKVIWNDGENIHYVTENDRHNVKQTPITRFQEIVNNAQGHR